MVSWLILMQVACTSKKKISYIDVLNKMKDLRSLAFLPEKGENCAQWSSWDRQSKYNEKTGKYENWGANGDGSGNYIRKEGKSIVMAEMEGPGAIVRIWSAQPEKGHVKIYIDGQTTPVVDLPFHQYFDHSVFPFNKEGISYKVAEGYDCYLPITYNKSCKVVADSAWGLYYHINYVSFSKDYQVEPFKMSFSEEQTKTLEEINTFFTKQQGIMPYSISNKDETIKGDIEIEPGKTIELGAIKGSRAIKSFKVFPHFMNRFDATIGLRKMILEMDWDELGNPEVWSPLGDFFGTTPAVNPYHTLPLGMTDSLMYSYWYMPFSKSATIKITNSGNKKYSFSYEIIHEPIEKTEKFGQFHAKWHGDLEQVSDDRWPDWELLKTTGSGRFVGVMLHVMNPKGEDCQQYAKDGYPWWGEGDEKFFVDGEKMPSTFGTGSEDYFGYAWGNPSFFQKPYHSQSMTMSNIGHQTLSRMHITDNIPFQNSFDAYIEKYYPNACGTLYNTVVYWYLSSNGKDLYKPVNVNIDHFTIPPDIHAENNYCIQGDIIEVSIAKSEDIVYYTLDNTIPDSLSLVFKDKLKISKECTITCKAYNPLSKVWSLPSKVELKMSTWQDAVKDLKDLQPGLVYSYYEKDISWTKILDYSTMEPAITGVADTIGLNMKHREDNFGVRFKGYISIPEDGVYTFFLNSDDGSKLYIRDLLVIDNDKNHGFIEKSGRAALKKGYHSIIIDYYESCLYQGITFSVASPTIKKQNVPATMLFHTKDK